MAIYDLLGGTPANYVLGRGKLYIQGEFSGSPLGWRDVGNATAFTLTQKSEKKEHSSYLSGVKTVDLEVAVSSKVSVSFTIDEVPLISDEFTSMTLTGSAERNETGYPTSPVGRFYTHADA